MHRSYVIAAALVLFASLAPGQQKLVPSAHVGTIPNWSAPPFWSPPEGIQLPEKHDSGGLRIEGALPALPTSPFPFIGISPCRLVDTRQAGFPAGYGPPALTGGVPRDFDLNDDPLCPGIPASVGAYSLNVTVTNTQGPGFILIYPQGGAQPPVSTLNYVAGQTIANAAVVPAGTDGGVTVIAGVSGTDLIIDINGYYGGSGLLQLSQSRRAILDQFWTPQNATVLGFTTVGPGPVQVRSDGVDLWVTNGNGASVSRVRASDGRLVETWTGVANSWGVLVAMGRVFATGDTSPGHLYRIDPSQPAGLVTTIASNLGDYPFAIAFDGARIWTANVGGSVSIVTPGATLPWSVTTVSTGFSMPTGALYDGANVWVTDQGAGTLLKLDGNGSILQTVTVGGLPEFPIFDGTNIWVPNYGSNSVSVVRASTGAALATLIGNGLNGPMSAAFDGQRVLVTNWVGGSVSLWRAADLTPLGSFSTGANPGGACSDGVNFWITLGGAGNQLLRF